MEDRLEIQLARHLVVPLVEFMAPLLDPGRGDLPAAADLEGIDRDMRESWRDDLAAAHTADLAVFRDLFGEYFRETGVIEFPKASCDAIIRACSSLRLRIRSGVLAGISDEAMEEGDLDIGTMGQEAKTGFTAYVFLGSLQEILVEHLDPDFGKE